MLTYSTVASSVKHTATVLLLHGLGDSSHGWLPVAKALSSHLPHVKWILPNAPEMPITWNSGYRMPGWYDIISLDKEEKSQDERGMMDSVEKLSKIIDKEVDEHKIPLNRIVIAGFSQGAVMSMLYGLTHHHKLGGIIAMSGYLPIHWKFHEIIKHKDIPILQCHGDQDQVVMFEHGVNSNTWLNDLGCNVTFKVYPGIGHGACDEELGDVLQFLKGLL